MTTPFEQGQKEGIWTPERIQACGFSSAAECLAYQEQVYRDEIAELRELTSPEYAARQKEYLEGRITATRASLKG